MQNEYKSWIGFNKLLVTEKPNLRCNHYTIADSSLLSAGRWYGLYSSLICKLLTDQTFAGIGVEWTRLVIPISWWCLTANRCSSGCIHVAAWLAGISIGFPWSPVLVGRKRAIWPIESFVAWFVLEANPNFWDGWRSLSCKSQNEVVFSLAGNFHQFCTWVLAELLGVASCLDWGRSQITKAVVQKPAMLALINGDACEVCDVFRGNNSRKLILPTAFYWKHQSRDWGGQGLVWLQPYHFFAWVDILGLQNKYDSIINCLTVTIFFFCLGQI